MLSQTLLVIGDPAARFLKTLSRVPDHTRVVVSQDPEELERSASAADAILFAHTDGELLSRVLPRAYRVRWIHCLWTGVEVILKPELFDHPATLTNGRGVFRWPLADWVTAAMLFFAFDLRRIVDQQN